ncbi:MAG TPA: YdcF family protein [Clostridiales bacterium]|jgi:vancomycin permeability regulator SanA|nr:YdcF family protein [Clostridiales bacterium]
MIIASYGFSPVDQPTTPNTAYAGVIYLDKRKYCLKCMICIFAVIFLWFLIHTAIIIFDGLNDKIGPSDVAVVLGNKVELDGKPSKRLKGRLDRAAELYKEEYFKYVLVSGGTGKEGFDEAAVMKTYLVEKGVPDEAVLLDQEGYNSFMTAQNTKRIMSEMKLNSVTIISQFYHITRTKLAFKKVGFDKVYTAHAKYFEIRDIYSLIREFFAYYKYLFM